MVEPATGAGTLMPPTIPILVYIYPNGEFRAAFVTSEPAQDCLRPAILRYFQRSDSSKTHLERAIAANVAPFERTSNGEADMIWEVGLETRPQAHCPGVLLTFAFGSPILAKLLKAFGGLRCR